MTAPTVIKTYYWLTKPGIVYGNAFAATGGFCLGAIDNFVWYRGVLMVVGLSCVIASACVFNNYIDRGIDAHMARTKRRAFAQGSIRTTPALSFGGALAILGFGVLSTLNMLSVIIAAVGFVFYVVLYGWSKRHSVHGTLVGSVSGAIPPVVGYVAATGVLDVSAFLLFAAMTAWQMPHFYAIAIYRLKDYGAIDMPVLPRVQGVVVARRYIQAYIGLFVGATVLLSVYGATEWLFAMVMILVGLWWYWQSLSKLFLREPAIWARQSFRRSLVVLVAFSGMLALERWMP